VDETYVKILGKWRYLYRGVDLVTDKAAFYPSAIRTCVPNAKHTATGFYNLSAARWCGSV
jgi:transposase-like protein